MLWEPKDYIVISFYNEEIKSQNTELFVYFQPVVNGRAVRGLHIPAPGCVCVLSLYDAGMTIIYLLLKTLTSE